MVLIHVASVINGCELERQTGKKHCTRDHYHLPAKQAVICCYSNCCCCIMTELCVIMFYRLTMLDETVLLHFTGEQSLLHITVI